MDQIPTAPPQRSIVAQDGPYFTPMTVRPEITNRREIVQTLSGENTSGNMIDYALPQGRHDLTVRCAPGVKVEWKPSLAPHGYVKIWHVNMTKAEAG